MVEIKAADLEVRCFFTWRMKGHIRSYGSVWKKTMGLEGSGACGAVGIGTGTWAVLSRIPEG